MISLDLLVVVFTLLLKLNLTLRFMPLVLLLSASRPLVPRLQGRTVFYYQCVQVRDQ
jgi:hypothetical protein